jgi:mono/diheme cytochrome c family protein
MRNAHARANEETEMNFANNTLALLGVSALVAACSTAPSTTTKVTYDNGIRQLVDKRCAECHGSDAPSMEAFKKDQEGYKAKKLGPRMDTYENIMVMVNGSDTGAMMRRLDDGANTKDNQPGNMHKYLGKDDAERAANLALFKNWVGGWNLKRAKDITEEERKSVLAPRN